MHKHVQSVIAAWKEFRRVRPDIAAELRAFVLSICDKMTAEDRRKQVEAMLASEKATKLREIVKQFADELKLRDDSDNELALWVRTICFFEVTERERSH